MKPVIPFRAPIALLVAFIAIVTVTGVGQAQQKPNILVIFGDDIGIPQISAYTMGMMGYRTPNIDRIAREGATRRSRAWSATSRPASARCPPGR